MYVWTPERKAAKRAEMRAALASPYRGLRLFFYVLFAGSGLIGTMVFLSRTLGAVARGGLWGQELLMVFLHLVLLVVMVILFRAERQRADQQAQRYLEKQATR